MPKPNSKKSKKDKEKKEDDAPDKASLFRIYLKECTRVGIDVNETIKRELCVSENPNGSCQLLLGPDDDKSPLIGDGGCRALFSAILDDKDKYTAFEDIRIWRSNLSDQGAKAISNLLSKCNGVDYKVKFLQLSDNRIGPLGALYLGRSLCAGMNKTLLNLNLDFNNTLTSDGVSGLAKGLKLNSTLQRLSLRFCGIDERGGKAISDILSFQKSSIKSIDLEGNHLGGIGLKECCPGIQINTSLTLLVLADNNLTLNDDEALDAFGNAISKHSSLTEINLLRNVIGESGALTLSKHLAVNKKIATVKVDTSLSSETYERLCRIPVFEKKKKKKKKKKK